MKLYSIWWEEEIALMCSCNDCSKKKNRRRRENCLPFASCESLERNQSFESEVFCFVQSQLTPPNSCSSELTQMPTTGSQGLTQEISNCFDMPRPLVSRPFDSQRPLVILPKKKKSVNAFGDEEWGLMFEGSTQLLVEHEKVAVGGTCLLFLALHISQTLFGKG